MNIMPKVIYEALEYLALSPTSMLVQLADSTIRYPKRIAEHIFVRVRDSFILADFVVMDMEGDLGVDLVLGRSFLRSAKARIDVGKGEICFRVGREDMFFRFKKREEQRFMIQQDSEGQVLWGAPEPQPEQRPSVPKRKKKEKKVWRKVESSASSVLQDELTDGKNDGEKYCVSDFKRRALAKGKLEFISYLLSPLFNIFFAPYFQNCFLHAGIFLAFFPFYKKTKNIF